MIKHLEVALVLAAAMVVHAHELPCHGSSTLGCNLAGGSGSARKLLVIAQEDMHAAELHNNPFGDGRTGKGRLLRTPSLWQASTNSNEQEPLGVRRMMPGGGRGAKGL